MNVPTVVLKPKHALPFHARHPWVFAGAIDRVIGEPADGAEVDLLAAEGGFIARGLFNGRSKIRVRLYSWTAGQALDRDLGYPTIYHFTQLRRSRRHFKARSQFLVADSLIAGLFPFT